ncbi:hypothetical protein SEA_DRHAYES_86 [Mycobacterium phage DrHayes]|uniref:Uncharacterized protein n=1 Tax=Mycobacterium phage Urkel TaxID=1912978 RepID=A0A1I9S4W7_9CAUD|nr:hypothetical protein I5H07_gp17 [Mycobacterium phage Urkel]AOZ61417.1 hypothetical protein SEA_SAMUELLPLAQSON_86 [Mycobacterium phage SamuelLPlaqson]AOZ61514.1 hypothetical protein SEA_DRHAYES_86 [Mycobacterium phage DrHayes]AOZ61611.1 hypothetical protein SEA_URKEL_86 [Mycobacterium phage Urkel]
MLNDPNAHSLLVSSRWRQGGQTTALLDIALANARRGLDVAFWSARAVESESAFRLGLRLAHGDLDVKFSGTNGRQSIAYQRSGGCVLFIWGHSGRYDRGHDMEIRDDNGLSGLIQRRSGRRESSVF